MRSSQVVGTKRYRKWEELKERIKPIVVWMNREGNKKTDDIVDKEFRDNIREGEYPE